jgi:tetratricopeptide (TPR) repeat protein
MKKLSYLMLLIILLPVACTKNNTELYNEACGLEEKKDFAKAVELLTKALEINPLDLECLNNRAWDYYDLGQKDKALDDFNKMLEIDSLSTGALYGISCLYYENQEYEQALRNFNKIIDIQGTLKFEANRLKRKQVINAPLDLVFVFKQVAEDSLGLLAPADTTLVTAQD